MPASAVASNRDPPRLLVVVVAYHAEATIADVLRRLPARIPGVATEMLVLDDSSTDRTLEVVQRDAQSLSPHPVRVLRNPVNQGYGGNQKIGYHYAIAHGFDLVALVHGDGQYAPEELPRLIEPVLRGEADAVFGSRMLRGTSALRGGMPIYKFVGNRILTFIQNRLTGAGLSEYHSGYRIYAVRALRRIAFQRNTNDFHFDTEIILQLISAGQRIVELPIPTHYGDEVCRVNGLRYARDVIAASLLWRVQSTGLLHDTKYARPVGSPYVAKLDFPSTHSWVRNAIPAGSRVLDIGCAEGHVARSLADKGCTVIGMDVQEPVDRSPFTRFIVQDLDEGLADPGAAVDYVLALDVIEHLRHPERLAEEIHRFAGRNRDIRLVISTGNIGFVVIRLMLLLGQFNYGPRGILDLTHTRLFTFAALLRLLRDNGFVVERTVGIPAPFPLAVGRGRLGNMLIKVNQALIRLSRGLFAYQMLMVCRPVPALDWLIEDAIDDTMRRSRERTVTAVEE
jgi:glycosyltransferase involved in cell wall biosynthesis